MGIIVYYSSISDNTHRFVKKLELPAFRIPVNNGDALTIDEPYVLILPTYAGGKDECGNHIGAVPKPVIRFLNDSHNRSFIRGVIAAGNTNFGDAFCVAGDIISKKCQVPYLYRFELMGTMEDVQRVREGLEQFWHRQ
ncbi:class Ib ribonucleoside-diphosphate reductase assembly flavoprotein NrdI [Hoyosella rhizosphaerae]|uniref:Protein NrdI n=1 Tax=Hoyosella rhizosphaerae TaxID=1755582 RepID=A0A916XEX1_9ACTN|nr:class Ib ribonucleoside-diphosphate reductase assembly flavoprotein NrdI [Hoyosella rhizosphaerae]MBN4925899.1 class Ib ribonucleoside-diphosphate reductase assembly flavoprotein NrdI [Hoyosella rhizosphaerae]GGC67085.1 protein NrdI [Hoyosella rhizosphaerae]